MKLKNLNLVSGLLVALTFSFLHAQETEAAKFKFAKVSENIADSEDNYNSFSIEGANINDRGDIVFRDTYTTYKASNGSIQTIFYSWYGNDLHHLPSLNNNGTVAIGDPAYFQNSEGDEGAIISKDANNVTKLIADTRNGRFSSFDISYGNCGEDPCPRTDINDREQVAFGARLNDGSFGIFLGNGDNTKIINLSQNIDFNYLFSKSGDNPFSLNNNNQVAFLDGYLTGEGYNSVQEIFIGDGEQKTKIADTQGIFSNFAFENFGIGASDSAFNIGLNDAGNVAFSARLDTGEDGIFMWDGQDFRTIVDSGTEFNSFGTFSFNNRNQIGFLGSADGVREGIFTGSNVNTDRLIAVGDSLFGSIVTDLNFGVGGLNNRGNIVFTALLEDGRSVVVKAEAVPEPASIVGTLGLGIIGASYWRKRRQKSNFLT